MARTLDPALSSPDVDVYAITNGTLRGYDYVIVPGGPLDIEQQLYDRLTERIALLDSLIAYPDVPAVPAGTLTTAQLSTVARALRDEVQANRQGAQRLAEQVRDLFRYIRGDFSQLD